MYRETTGAMLPDLRRLSLSHASEVTDAYSDDLQRVVGGRRPDAHAEGVECWDRWLGNMDRSILKVFEKRRYEMRMLKESIPLMKQQIKSAVAQKNQYEATGEREAASVILTIVNLVRRYQENVARLELLKKQKPMIVLTAVGYAVLEMRFLERLRDLHGETVDDWIIVLIDPGMPPEQAKNVEMRLRVDLVSSITPLSGVNLRYFTNYADARAYVHGKGEDVYLLVTGAINKGHHNVQDIAQRAEFVEESTMESAFWELLAEMGPTAAWNEAYYNYEQGYRHAVKFVAEKAQEEAGRAKLAHDLAQLNGKLPSHPAVVN